MEFESTDHLLKPLSRLVADECKSAQALCTTKDWKMITHGWPPSEQGVPRDAMVLNAVLAEAGGINAWKALLPKLAEIASQVMRERHIASSMAVDRRTLEKYFDDGANPLKNMDGLVRYIHKHTNHVEALESFDARAPRSSSSSSSGLHESSSGPSSLRPHPPPGASTRQNGRRATLE